LSWDSGFQKSHFFILLTVFLFCSKRQWKPSLPSRSDHRLCLPPCVTHKWLALHSQPLQFTQHIYSYKEFAFPFALTCRLYQRCQWSSPAGVSRAESCILPLVQDMQCLILDVNSKNIHLCSFSCLSLFISPHL